MAQSINLQITPNGVIPTIYASQFDVGREITFNLYDGSTAYTPPAGSTIRFEGKKSDGNGFSYNCTYVDNVVTMALTDQMTVFAEEVPCELRIADTDNNDIGTLNILLSVEKSPIDGNTPMSDTEIPAIIELARTEQYNAEAWAEGTRNGTPVGPTDPTYQNNAKYYAEHSSASVSSLSDTDIQNVADNQILVYDGVDSKWENKVNNINRLADVHILNPSDGQSLIYDANDDKWVNGSGGGGSSTLGGLTDVTLTTPANGQILQYDANDDEWVNANAPSGGGLLPYLYITTEADAMVFVRSNDYPDIYPTEVTTGHWECELPDYGLYTVHSDIEGDDATYTIDVDAVKEYSVTVMHYTHTINITVMSGASITITDGVETITGTGTGSSEAFTVHNASTVYTVTTSVDGASAPAQTVTTPAQSEQSTSLTFQYGTINLTYANEFRGITLTCSSGGTTITKTAPATGNSMAFYPPSTGTWTITGVYSGVTYSSGSITVSSLSTAVPATLQTNVTLTVTLYGAVEDTISFTDESGAKTEVFASGQSSKSVSIVIPPNGMSITFTSSVAKNPSDLTADYSKTVTISSGTTEVEVMPDGALYWYGNLVNAESANVANGWSNSSNSFLDVTFNTRQAHLNRNNSGTLPQCALGSSTSIDFSQYSSLKLIGYIENSSTAQRVFLKPSKNLAETAIIDKQMRDDLGFDTNSSKLGTVDISSVTSSGYALAFTFYDAGAFIDAMWLE